MLELILVFLLFLATFWIASKILLVGLFVIVLALVLPGLYALLKGAPFLPTSRKKIQTMIKFADLKGDEIVVDLGCGDGRVIRAFAHEGVKRAIGYEFSLLTYVLAKLISLFKGGREEIIFADFWKADLSQADIVICFLLDKSMKDCERLLWPKLKKGAKVLSNEFQMAKIKPVKMRDRVFLYVKN